MDDPQKVFGSFDHRIGDGAFRKGLILIDGRGVCEGVDKSLGLPLLGNPVDKK